MNKDEKFLDNIYPKLHNSNEVMHTALISDNKYVKIKKYLNRLEKTHTNLSYNNRNYLLHLYHKKYVIKSDNYVVIKGQINSLDTWLNYLIDSSYPMYIKYFIFNGIIKIGSGYNKRTSSTTYPFIELNPYVVDKTLESGSKNFAKTYITLLEEYKKERLRQCGIEGTWVKYERRNSKDAIKLKKDLEGTNNGWCLEMNDYFIDEYITKGDIYIYYSKDEENKYTIPRIAITTNGKYLIDEIKGVADRFENIESGVECIIEDKLNEMMYLNPRNRNYYLSIIKDSSMLTSIENKLNNGIKLTNKEIDFIYEKNRPISYLGYVKDTRIEKLKMKIKR